MFTVRLVYFKQSGKYYDEGIHKVTSDPIGPSSDEAQPSMYDVIEEVKTMGPRPGLIHNWSQGSILVEPVGDWGYPCLIRIS